MVIWFHLKFKLLKLYIYIQKVNCIFTPLHTKIAKYANSQDDNLVLNIQITYVKQKYIHACESVWNLIAVLIEPLLVCMLR